MLMLVSYKQAYIWPEVIEVQVVQYIQLLICMHSLHTRYLCIHSRNTSRNSPRFNNANKQVYGTCIIVETHHTHANIDHVAAVQQNLRWPGVILDTQRGCSATSYSIARVCLVCFATSHHHYMLCFTNCRTATSKRLNCRLSHGAGPWIKKQRSDVG